MKNLDDRKRRTILFSLRSKMLLYFGALFVIVLSVAVLVDKYGIPFLPFGGEYQQHQSEAFQSLNLVADLKEERLLRWIEERRDDVKVLSESSLIKDYGSALSTVIKESTRQPGNEDELWSAVRREKRYQEMTRQLNLVKDAYGVYETIQLSDAQKGIIIASTRDEDLSTDISSRTIFTNALLRGKTEAIGIEKDPETDDVSLVISRAVRADDEVIVVLIAHIRLDDFIKPMLRTGEGLGRAGEALLINKDVRIISPLKHTLTDGSIATPLEYQINAQPAVLAARGEEGIITTRDYRGVPVLAAYRHLQITPELRWGMVVKQDQAEVFSGIRKSMFYGLIIGLIGILTALAFTYFIAVNLSRPIQILSQTAKQVEGGNLDVRAPTGLTHEVGTLAITFNSMIQRIQNWKEELDHQVQTRTAELTRVSEERERLNRRLMETNEELEQVVYISSHDLRTPLVSIHGFAKELNNALKTINQTLNREDVPLTVKSRLSSIIKEDIPDYLQYIFTSTTKMDSLISGLLQISRLGKVELDIQKLNMNKLISEVREAFKFQVQKAGATANVEKLPMCMGDETRINQVFSNLLDNALKYLNPDREGVITISGRRQAGDSIYTVEDNGMGISEKDQAKIFGIFHRVDPESGNGEGLGLTIVQKIVNRHYGRMWVESMLGEGSKFFVSLPSGGRRT